MMDMFGKGVRFNLARVFSVLACVIVWLSFPSNATGLSSQEQLGSAVWQGSASCAAGLVFVTVSTEIVKPGARQVPVRIELADSPGGVPWARSYSNFSKRPNGSYLLHASRWSFRPMDMSQQTGELRGLKINLSEDGQELTINPFGSCKGLTLKKASAIAAMGGIKTAQDLPTEFIGTIGCHGSRPSFAVKLTLSPTGDTTLDGKLAFMPADRNRGSKIGIFSIIGDYAPSSGTLTLIGDQWIQKVRSIRDVFDFTAELRDGGQRLIGQSSWGNCGIVDLNIPGADYAEKISRPTTPVPILEWDTPSACVSLIKWAGQATAENGGRSVYTSGTAAGTMKLGIGLFADERFVPFFGKPFAELIAEERKYITQINQACKIQQTFVHDIFHSGANSFVTGYFPDRASTKWLKLRRFNILRKRLSKEMDALEIRSVGEADISTLRSTLDGLDDRFSELWTIDKAQARALLESKLDVAHGTMANRLETEIDQLPQDWRAFDVERTIRSEIVRFGEDRRQDQLRLTGSLDFKLALTTDSLLGELAAEFAARVPGLATLSDLRTKIEAGWSQLKDHLNINGPGYQEFQRVTAMFAAASFSDFQAIARNMIDDAAPFDQRERQYVAAINFYGRLVPSGRQFKQTFAQYAEVIDRMRPVPTLKDLVGSDGSPTSLGLKIATSDWLDHTWAMTFAFLPYNLSFVTKSIRVSGVRKVSCKNANAGGYWCNFRLSMGGSLPFLDLLSLMPNKARFTLNNEQWVLVELKTNPRPPLGSAYQPRDYISDPIVPWEDFM